MKQYLDLVQQVLENLKGDRTGTGTKKCFWIPNAFWLERFPMVTTKATLKIYYYELLSWGDTNIGYLKEMVWKFGTHGQTQMEIWTCIWTPMRNWIGGEIDQIAD
jgi:thymidylate synthase